DLGAGDVLGVERLGEQRVDDRLGERCDDRRERGADDDGDCELDHIALHQELLEALHGVLLESVLVVKGWERLGQATVPAPPLDAVEVFAAGWGLLGVFAADESPLVFVVEESPPLLAAEDPPGPLLAAARESVR